MMHNEDHLQGSADSWAASSPQRAWEHGAAPTIELSAEGEGGLAPSLEATVPLPRYRPERLI